MATIKSYTTVEQSRKLAEILPTESADMVIWGKDLDAIVATDAQKLMSCLNMNYLPCWSLAALINILPNAKLCHYDNSYFCQYMSRGDEFPKYSTMEYDNPIDACVAMIIKLYKLNLL